MKKLLLATLLAAALPFTAQALEMGDHVGSTKAEITDTLSKLGYDVRGFKMEGGMMEVAVVKGNMMGEFVVDTATGNVVQLEGAAEGAEGGN